MEWENYVTCINLFMKAICRIGKPIAFLQCVHDTTRLLRNAITYSYLICTLFQKWVFITCKISFDMMHLRYITQTDDSESSVHKWKSFINTT